MVVRINKGENEADTFVPIQLIRKPCQRGDLLGISAADDDTNIVRVEIRRQLFQLSAVAVIKDQIIIVLAVGVILVFVKEDILIDKPSAFILLFDV